VFAVAAATEPDAVVPEKTVKEGAIVEQLYVKNETAYPSFDSKATGSFSRRRSTVAPQDETGRKFDKMFKSYYDDPTKDLANGLREHVLHEMAKKASTAPTTVVGNAAPNEQNKTVEVINELKEVKPGELPAPSSDAPPVVDTINGKDYEIKKVVRVQKTVQGEAPPRSAPTVNEAQNTGQEISDTPKQMSVDAHTPSGAVDECTSCFEKFQQKDGCDLWSKGEDASEALDKECSQSCVLKISGMCKLAEAGRDVLRGNVKKKATIAPPPIEHPLKQSHQPNIVEGDVKIPMDVDHAEKEYQAIPSGRLTLPPLAEPNKEPEIIREPEVQKVPAIHTTPKRPPDTEAKAPEYTPPAAETTDVPEDGVFGKPSGGTWNFGKHGESGDSDFGSAAPWDETKTDGPGEEVAPVESLLEEEAPDWAKNAESAPWQDEDDAPINGLLQMAARSCAARKVRQSASCKMAKDTASKNCEADSQKCDEAHRNAQQHCDSTAKATFKACFEDWQMAKKGK